MPKPLECDTAVSALVLQAARQAIPSNVDALMPLPDCGELNRPLLPLLVALLESGKATAQAVAETPGMAGSRWVGSWRRSW